MKILKTLAALLLISCLLILCACNSSSCKDCKLAYSPAPELDLGKMSKSDSLFIPSIIDKRDKAERSAYKPDTDPLILIPFWFYCHSNLDPVIRFSYFQPSLIDALNKLFVMDINKAGIFKQVLGMPEGINQADFEKELYEEIPNAYKLEITLQEALWSRNLTSYGLSYLGTFLWAIGFPVSYGNVYFSIDAVLYAPNHKEIGRKRIGRELPCTEWIYDQVNYKPAISEIKLAALFPEVTKELREFIFQKLSEDQTKNRRNLLKTRVMEEAQDPGL